MILKTNRPTLCPWLRSFRIIIFSATLACWNIGWGSYRFIESSLDLSNHLITNMTTSNKQSDKQNKLDSMDMMMTPRIVDSNERISIVPNEVSIAFTITISSCPPNATYVTIDGPAILSHSIHLLHSDLDHPYKSKYRNYSLYAIIHPEAEGCTRHLTKLGYQRLIRSIPFNTRKIESNEYRYQIELNGCCGSREFLKLWGYTLVQHSVVVQLDVDGFLNLPLDPLLDVMMLKQNFSIHDIDTSDKFLEPRFRLHPSFGMISGVDFAFTRDYYQQSKITTDRQKYGVQGGFFVLRPSWDTFHNMTRLLLEGNYTVVKGWARSYFGGYYGSPQIQGFLSFYYATFHPDRAIELNRCYYNTILDDPYDNSGLCKSGLDTCQLCSDVPLSEMFFVHLTLCWKPWQCPKLKSSKSERCRDVHRAWFTIRKSLEESWGYNTSISDAAFFPHISLGYCLHPPNPKARAFYQRMKLP